MDIDKLLETHEILGKQLIEIPSQRTITYREDMEDGELIGKPRFTPAVYLWAPELFTSLRDHLQNIWNYFWDNSFWFDDNLKEILLSDSRRLSKKSIIFLLERDIWEMDEIYGAFLIKLEQNMTKISYYRFGHEFKTFSFKDMDKSSREKWICQDAIQQIKNQFKLLWNKLEIEINACQIETFHRPISIQLTDMDLIKHYDVCTSLLEISEEAALLMLGRLQELWLLKSLKISRIEKDEKLFSLAASKGLINKVNKKVFLQIRTNYNLLKHTTTYNINNCDLENLIKQFGLYLDKTK